MNTHPDCRGPSRRQALKFGAVSLATAGLAGVKPFQLRAETGPGKDSNSPAVIFIWLPGGPPHQDTFDMKPDAPSEYRGEFKPIATNVSGIQICEHMPKMAKIADQYSIIRSVSHTFADHGGGHKKFLTGRDPIEPTGFVNDYPMVGSMAAKLLEKPGLGMPNYICGVDGGRQGIDTFSFGSAYLGPSSHPFMAIGDPSEATFGVKNLTPIPGTEKHLADRLGLLNRVDDRIVSDLHGTADGITATRKRALDMISSDKARIAFELAKESTSTREMYGMHRYGQRCLLARRLVEAGAQWVTMVLENSTPPGKPMIEDGTYNWDSHAVNCNIFTDTKYKLGFFDQAISALITDLYQRGLDKKVLLVVTGEFGRTPKIEYAKNRPGRDHWPQAQSIVVSGGGKRMGQTIGSTTSKAETPKDRPLTPNDLWATVFQHLQIDYRAASFLDATGRPMPMLTDGNPISELG
ncbi:MAG: DUF1501 domain-containing protein [Fimbriiglobus sp.]